MQLPPQDERENPVQSDQGAHLNQKEAHLPAVLKKDLPQEREEGGNAVKRLPDGSRRFHVALEPIQNHLPSSALHVFGVHALGVKRLGHAGALRSFLKGGDPTSLIV